MVGLIATMLMQLPRKRESSKANHTSSLELGKRYMAMPMHWRELNMNVNMDVLPCKSCAPAKLSH